MKNGMFRRVVRSAPVQQRLADFRLMPMPGRWAAGGATCLGIAGAVTGLVIGLIVHPPTAPFAMIELGLPSTIVGGVIGLVAGMIMMALRHLWRRG